MYAEISKLKRSCEDSDEELLPLSETVHPSTGGPSTSSFQSTGGPSTPSFQCTGEPSKPVTSQPSTSLHLFSSEPSTSTNSSKTQPENVPNQSKELECVCPTCVQYFSIDKIPEHADICCDVWVGEINSENTGSEDSSPNASPERVIIPDESTDVKDKVLEIKAATLSANVVRLNVCRKCIWCDFNEYQSNGKVSPTDSVKIVFVGEPAIDNGGPKREFFSGNATYQYIVSQWL